MEVGTNCLSELPRFGGCFAEEAFQGVELGRGVGNHFGVVDFDEIDVFTLPQLGKCLFGVGLLGLDEVLFFGDGILSAALDHFPLGVDDFFDGALHEDDAVSVAGWKLGQEGGDDFDDFTVGLLDEAGVLFKGFDLFPFPVSFEVVFIGLAFAVVHEVHAGGAEHLHHQRGATAREAGDDGEGAGFDGGFFGGFFGGGFAFGVAGFGAGGDAVAKGSEVFFASGGTNDFLADEVGFESFGFFGLLGYLIDFFEGG